MIYDVIVAYHQFKRRRTKWQVSSTRLEASEPPPRLVRSDSQEVSRYVDADDPEASIQQYLRLDSRATTYVKNHISVLRKVTEHHFMNLIVENLISEPEIVVISHLVVEVSDSLWI